MYSISLSTLKIVRRFPFQGSSVLSSVSNFNINNNDYLYNSCKRYTTRGEITDDRRKPIGSGPSFDNIPLQITEILRDVKMKELNNVPLPTFWGGMLTIVPLAFTPLAFLLTGYSPFLLSCHLTYAASLLSYLGGTKFGYDLDDTPANWDKVFWTSAPLTIGWMSLLLPQPLALLTLSGGFLLSAFIDITTGSFKPWYKSLRLALVIPSVLCLLLAFLWRIFH